MTKHKKAPKPTSPLTPADVARMQRAVAVKNGGGVPEGSYIGDLQRHVAPKDVEPKK